MKKRTIKFNFEIEVAYSEHLDDDWVADQYLSGPRFSIEGFRGEPAVILCAVSGVEEVRSYG